MTLANLEIKRNEGTTGGYKFIVDGHELKGVRSFTLNLPRDDAPVARVEFLVGGVDIDAAALLELQAAYICQQTEQKKTMPSCKSCSHVEERALYYYCRHHGFNVYKEADCRRFKPKGGDNNG